MLDAPDSAPSETATIGRTWTEAAMSVPAAMAIASPETLKAITAVDISNLSNPYRRTIQYKPP
jgi:hypothetical protein